MYPVHTPDLYHLTWIWTWPGMGQCLVLHADVTFQRRARPPFWDLPQTQHITNHGRSGLRAMVEIHTAQANVVWPGTFLTRNKRLARNAAKCRVLLYIVLGAVWGIGLCRAVATLVSANFQINISAISYWKRVWMDSFFLRSSPDEGQSEEHTDWGYCRQSCWMCVYSKWTFFFIVVVPISPVGCLVSGSLTLAINRVFVPQGAGRAVRCLIAPHFPG